MVTFLVLTFFLFVMLIPIPIKLTFHISKGNYFIKFYNFVLLSPTKGILREYFKKLYYKISSKYAKELNNNEEKMKVQSHNPLPKKQKKRKLSICKLYKRLYNNKFKPTIKLKGDINYELSDAGITAILFGVLSNLNPLLYFSFSKVLVVKDLTLNINPHFTGKNMLNFTITSIFSFNIAQIIYILLLTIKSFDNKKEVGPK